MLRNAVDFVIFIKDGECLVEHPITRHGAGQAIPMALSSLIVGAGGSHAFSTIRRDRAVPEPGLPWLAMPCGQMVS